MAGKGGGAWKVAYADFVTAMMAFFLVMWLVTQDKQVKDAVARYFTDPVGFYQVGSNKKPGDAGAIFDSPMQGKVPGKGFQVLGRGRGSHTDRGQGEMETQAVSHWLKADPDVTAYWKAQAKRQEAAAALSDMVNHGVVSVREAARIQLANQLESEISEKIPSDLEPVYHELMITSLSYVDWTGIAEECLQQ